MLHGEFPLSYAPGQSHLHATLAPVDLASFLSRRRWLLGAAVFAAGAGASTLWRELETPAAAHSQPISRCTVEWAQWLASGPPEDLIRWAGDLERTRLNHPRDDRLVPIFERLARLALQSHEPEADTAGAIAVRSLERLGHTGLLDSLAPRVRARTDRPEMRAALAAARR